MAVVAASIIRFIPYIYLVSPSTSQETKLRLDDGLKPLDAIDLAQRCLTADFMDTPDEVLGQARLVNLVAMAQDWRFMTEDEISAFLARDMLDETGVSAPDVPEEDDPSGAREMDDAA